MTRILPRLLLALGAFALAAPSASARTFTMSKEHGGLHRVSFENDAPFETITGISNVVEGSLEVDLDHPAKVTGSLEIPVASIRTGIAQRDEHLVSPQWLDAAKYPTIRFEITGIDAPDRPLKDGETLTAKVRGNITIKGVTKPITAAAKVSFHKVTEDRKKAWIMNDVLRIKALFKLNIRDFGITPPEHLAGVKVADEVEIKANLTPVAK